MELCSGLCGSWWEGSLGKNGYMYACKKIQPVHPKGDQSWVFIGRTDVEAAPILWPPHVKSWLIGKDSDAGKDWGQEEKGTTEDEMAGWHHRLDGHGFAKLWFLVESSRRKEVHSGSLRGHHNCRLKEKDVQLESWKFYLGQNADCSPRGSISNSSEKTAPKWQWEKVNI